MAGYSLEHRIAGGNDVITRGQGPGHMELRVVNTSLEEKLVLRLFRVTFTQIACIGNGFFYIKLIL